jgi:aminomethyltransferase
VRVSNIRYNGDCETYQILGGEAISIDLKSGDSVEIVDVEGDQKCSVLAFDSKKSSALSSLNWNTKPKNNSNKISSGDCSEMLKAILNGKKIKSKEFQAAELFSESSPADTRQSFNTNNDLLCVFDAEGGPMLVDQQNSPTEILINVSRSNPTIPSERLPEPLAKPTKEIRVKDSSAVAYKVKAGEYIQIIDVEGQQCSDFQAFIEEDLNNNLELCLDPTVTRSQMLASYPAPGTHDKFYNQNSVPLVEVIQDTVCRHDTFGLACNAKYYEDRGFPGHISCTDNFNSSLAEFGVAPRRNWAAVNLFFNTAIEECHSLSSDVSWSRPGDYVLLRAVDDLVCVSSACPDDTTSSNGWNPTDIHVRIYDKSNNFSSATAFRPDPQSIPTMTKETGFHKNTSKLTKNFDNYNGYWLPLEYTNLGAIKEYWQAREGVVMIDLAPLRKFEIYGQDSEVLMQYAITKDVRKLAIGQVVYSAMCYDNGCMIDDGTLFRLDDNNFRWIGGSDDGGKHLRKIAEDRGLDVRVKSSTDQLHNVAVQGPKSRETLSKIIWIPKLQTTIEDLKWFRFTIGRIGGEFGIPVMVSRTGLFGRIRL